MTIAGLRRSKSLCLFGVVLISFAAGFVFAIAVAKSSAPKQTIYELPHGFTVSAPTFLPSALPGPTMTSGNRLELLENGDAIFPAMLAAISSARETVNFEAYIFWSGEVGTRFRDALADRAAHGVAVQHGSGGDLRDQRGVLAGRYGLLEIELADRVAQIHVSDFSSGR